MAGIKAILALMVYKIIIWLVKLNLYLQIYLKYRLKKRGFGICKAMFGNNYGNKKSPYISVRALSSAPPIIQSCSTNKSFSELS